MADTNALILIEDLVDKIRLKARRKSFETLRLLELVIDAYRDLRIHNISEFKVVKLTMDELKMIDFPSDMIDYIGIYIPYNGRTWPLTLDRDIITTTTDVNGAETQDEDVGEGVTVTDGATWGYVARGGINDGYYAVDFQKRRFVFNKIDRSEVIISYISSGTSVTEETYISYKYVPAIEAKVLWEDALYDPQAPMNRIQAFENKYKQEMTKLEMSEFPSLDEIRDELYKSFSPLPDR